MFAGAVDGMTPRRDASGTVGEMRSARWREDVRPERPEPPPRRPSRLVVALTAVIAACLLLYGALTVLVASAWGPGNSDVIVSGGPELIPWFGLSGGGALAAAVGTALIVPRPGLARWVLLIAALSLAGWTVFLYHGT
jgi:hypothetical protein